MVLDEKLVLVERRDLMVRLSPIARASG
jgi:hypothetical protein